MAGSPVSLSTRMMEVSKGFLNSDSSSLRSAAAKRSARGSEEGCAMRCRPNLGGGESLVSEYGKQAGRWGVQGQLQCAAGANGQGRD